MEDPEDWEDEYNDITETERELLEAIALHGFFPQEEAEEDMNTNSPVADDLFYPFGTINDSAECEICLTKESRIRNRSCCQIPVCDNCMKVYFVTQLENGVKRMQCISDGCSQFAPVDEIMCRLPTELKDKFYKYLVDANNDPLVKTCPKCSFVQRVTKEQMNIPRKKKKYGILVVCEDCNLEWCFVCHAPWHSEGVTCKEYQKGDKLVKKWAKEFHFGNKNAERCPKCKVFIERIRGCDHMNCGNCGTNFCYKCGEKYTRLTFIGDHYGRFSPLGCKYRLHPNKPVLRRAIRGSVLGAKLLGGILLGGLAVGGAAIFVAVSPIVVPAYFGYRLRQRRRLRRMNNRTVTFDVHDFIDAIERDMIAQGLTPEAGLFIENIENSSSAVRDENESESFDEEKAEDVESIENVEVKAVMHKSSDDTNQEIEQDDDKDGSDDYDVPFYFTTVEIKNENQVHVSGGKKDNHVTTADIETQCGGQVVLHVKTVATPSSGEETRTPKERAEEIEDVVSDKGCFIKILKRLPSVWEKEKDGEKVQKQESMEDMKIPKEILTPPNGLKEGERSNSESVTLCDTLECLKQLQEESELKDPYCGLVATTDEITYL